MNQVHDVERHLLQRVRKLPGRSLVYAQGMKKCWSVESCTGSEWREPCAWRDKARAMSARNKRPAQENLWTYLLQMFFIAASLQSSLQMVWRALWITWAVTDILFRWRDEHRATMNRLLNKTCGPAYYKCSSSPHLSKVLCK